MGKKGARLTAEASEAAAEFSSRIMPLGDISTKKMFGGHGVFEGGKMFGLVDSSGVVFLKATDSNRGRFERAGADAHGRMPYYQIPMDVLDDDDLLLDWVRGAIEASKE